MHIFGRKYICEIHIHIMYINTTYINKKKILQHFSIWPNQLFPQNNEWHQITAKITGLYRSVDKMKPIDTENNAFNLGQKQIKKIVLSNSTEHLKFSLLPSMCRFVSEKKEIKTASFFFFFFCFHLSLQFKRSSWMSIWSSFDFLV